MLPCEPIKLSCCEILVGLRGRLLAVFVMSFRVPVVQPIRKYGREKDNLHHPPSLFWIQEDFTNRFLALLEYE